MKLYVLIGMIASGKSTYARELCRTGRAMAIAHDDLTEMLHQEYRYEQEHRKLYRDCEEVLAREILFKGLDVVIDRTHLTYESRSRWLSFATTFINGMERKCLETVAVQFPIESPEIHAGRRFAIDPRGRPYETWLHVARHHAEQARNCPLLASEGFDSIIYQEPS